MSSFLACSTVPALKLHGSGTNRSLYPDALIEDILVYGAHTGYHQLFGPPFATLAGTTITALFGATRSPLNPTGDPVAPYPCFVGPAPAAMIIDDPSGET